MALPNNLLTARLSDATTGNLIDDRIGDLEKAICDLHGIPIDQPISNAGFLWDATGLKKTIFQDNAADPAAAGELVRDGVRLKYHDGGAARRVSLSLAGSSGAEPVAVNTASITGLYVTAIPANSLGLDGMLAGHVDAYVNSILNGAALAFRLIFGNTLILTPTLNNNSGITQVNFGVKIDFRLSARNSTALQKYSFTAGIGVEAALLTWGGVTNTWTIHRTSFVTEDTTQNKNLQFDVQWSGASISNSVTGVGFEVHRLR